MIPSPADFAPPWHLPVHRAVLALAAARGLSPRDAGGLVHLGEGARLCRLDGVSSDRTPFLAGQLCRSRWLTHRALREAGLPVPHTLPASSPEAAITALTRLGAPVVLRPIQTLPPVGPSRELSDAASVAAAFRSHAPRGAVVAAAVSGPVARHLVVDRAWRPLAGEAPPLHPLDRLLVERAAAVCDIELAVVELTGAREDRPFTQSGARITALEPGLLAAATLAPDPEAFAALYLDHLFPAPHDGRIPLIAVVGDAAADAAAEIAAKFAAAGRCVGLATRHGLSVDGLVLAIDDRRGGSGLGLLVDHGSVAAGVVELSPGHGDPGHPLDLLALAGPVAESDVRALLPRLRIGVVGPANDALAAAAAASGLCWQVADARTMSRAVVAACGGHRG